MEKLLNLFEDARVVIAAIVTILGLLVALGVTCNDKANLKEDNVVLQNRAAELDHLRPVLTDAQNANFTLKERNSFLESDNITLRISNKTVTKRLSQTKSTLQSYMESNSTLTIENKNLKGTLRASGEAGEMAADYADSNAYYSFTAEAYLLPETYLNLALVVYDSTYAGIRRDGDGTYVGFVGHSNPFIQDNGASFSLAVDGTLVEQRFFSWTAGLGAMYSTSSLKWGPGAMLGIGLGSWGLQGTLSADNQGVLLTKRF